ncbi:hypothetical protein FGADI_11762 [Fusarium gaditjirri]|uniref:Uncharacterized protein n=1 Tax=Fusarium gaditjirri TaxID=282569 RepID=A0A8H4SU84_9HYPO|nr:hypothetical protein FGADI_11762 [Fusarium gaditjirri]
MVKTRRNIYDADVDDVHADNEDRRPWNKEQRFCPRSPRRIEIKRKIDRDHDDPQDDTHLPASEANTPLHPIETHKDEAIASPPTNIELPRTTDMAPYL